jgi:hypothetical protein
MEGWKRITMKNGRTRYMYQRKFIAATKVPFEIKAVLDRPRPDEEPPQPAPQSQGPKQERKCIFCGAHARFTKFVNLQTVYVCDDDYYDKSTGKIAEQLSKAKG